MGVTCLREFTDLLRLARPRYKVSQRAPHLFCIVQVGVPAQFELPCCAYTLDCADSDWEAQVRRETGSSHTHVLRMHGELEPSDSFQAVVSSSCRIGRLCGVGCCGSQHRGTAEGQRCKPKHETLLSVDRGECSLLYGRAPRLPETLTNRGWIAIPLSWGGGGGQCRWLPCNPCCRAPCHD